MDKYLEAENRLAELLGVSGDLSPGTLQETGKAWCRNDASAFRLMVEHDVERIPSQESTCCAITYGEDAEVVSVVGNYADHPDKATAVRHAPCHRAGCYQETGRSGEVT